MRINYSFSGPLTLIFIALKLTGHITWSWVLVISPIAIWFVLGTLVEWVLRRRMNDRT